MSRESEELTELELRIATLLRKYREVRTKLAVKTAECEALQQEQTEQKKKIERLKQNLSIATMASNSSQEAQNALESLERELEGITQVIDECITLLDSRIE